MRRHRSRVLLCVIAKNEAHNLWNCVAPVGDLVDDIVVVDTGSTDGTAEIARQLGARVFSFAWVDSFAAARNESLRHALGDWVLWLDADDRVDEANCGRLRVLLEHLPNENVGFVMKCLCLPDPKTGRGAGVDHVRLFRRHPGLRWRYRVHEQILPGLRALDGTVRWSDVVVQHTGYQDSALRQRKLERDFRLLGLEHAENPGDAFVLFNLGMILHEWGRCDEALPFLNESLRQSHPSDSIVRKLYGLISQCHRLGGRLEEALATCREGQRHYPHDLELLFHESVVRKQLGDRPGAEGCLLRLQFASEGDHFASVNPALRSAIARHNLAVLYREEGRDAEAETYWQAVVADNPDYLPSRIGLAELYMNQGRWPEFAAALAWLEADGRAGADTAMLRARSAARGGNR